ncbi:MAG TPA: hypothetical protein VNO23_11595 [Candidatus Binatia bacterium]|nr:hypothetical protein [Candidatus Binatia bacterium]
MLTPDEHAILFLCCENHEVECATCGRPRPVRTLRRRASDPDRWLCPRCRGDVTPGILKHIATCRYFVGRKPLARVASSEPPAAASA